jgi:hypothetical protein
MLLRDHYPSPRLGLQADSGGACDTIATTATDIASAADSRLPDSYQSE